MIATSIDLSKVPAKELPRKTVEADFGDGVKEYYIRPLNEADLVCLRTLPQNDPTTGQTDIMLPKKMYVLLLSAGLEVCQGQQDIAKLLLDERSAAAIHVGDAIFAFTNEFYAAKQNETEEAEKNFGQPESSGADA